MRQFDLIIIGGGFVGASLAKALSYNTKLRIALIDARIPQQNDPRLFALNISSWQFLKNIGLEKVLRPHASPINGVHVSQQGKFGSLRFSPDAVGFANLGYMLPAFQLEIALQASLADVNQKLDPAPSRGTLRAFSLLCPATLSALTQFADHVEIVIESDGSTEKIAADFVIGCDGTHSTVRELLGVKTTIQDYQQTAIVTQSKLARPHHGIAYERFTKRGVIAMLPLANDTCATIWSGEQQLMQHLKALSDAEFLNEVQQNFGFRLGRLQQISQRYAYPLQQVTATKMVVDRVMLLGNSAHTLHPIAAQGLNLAIYEIAMLVDAVMENKGVFSKDIFDQLSSQVASQQNASIGLSHRLTQLLYQQSLLTKTLLPLGVFALDKMPFCKTPFIKRMLGRSGRLPQLFMNAS